MSLIKTIKAYRGRIDRNPMPSFTTTHDMIYEGRRYLSYLKTRYIVVGGRDQVYRVYRSLLIPPYYPYLLVFVFLVPVTHLYPTTPLYYSSIPLSPITHFLLPIS